MSIHNVKANHIHCKEVIRTIGGRIRNKLRVLI